MVPKMDRMDKGMGKPMVLLMPDFLLIPIQSVGLNERKKQNVQYKIEFSDPSFFSYSISEKNSVVNVNLMNVLLIVLRANRFQ